MHRRQILQGMAAAAASATLSPLRIFAAPKAGAKLLVVFLRGGYDATNLLVPVSSRFYYEARPNIAIARPDAANVNAALPLDADWGLAPSLKDTIYPLWQKGQVAFIPFAGTDDLSRSHFETQDGIELGQPLGKSRNYDSGFLNRLMGVIGAEGDRRTGISFTDQLPIAFRGSRQIPNVALRSLNRPGVDARQAALIAGMYRDTPLAEKVLESFSVRDDVMREMSAEMEMASRNAITTKGFELEARRIAKLLRGDYGVGFVDVGGWDTHVGQGGATGQLANRLQELGQGLAGFADEMGPVWKDTVVVVVSEFGRTFRENGNRGTDHGHGTVYWVMGGSVSGGRVAGEQSKLEQPNLFQNRDYPVLNDYRAVLGGLFSRIYDLSPADLEKVFAGVPPKDLRLI